MTDKQTAFAQEYLKDQCGRDAAIRAGFSSISAASIASRLLRHPEVKAIIDERKANLAKLVSMSPEDIARKIGWYAFANVKADEIRPSDALKALELLGKWRGMFAETNVAAGAFQININLGDPATEPSPAIEVESE